MWKTGCMFATMALMVVAGNAQDVVYAIPPVAPRTDIGVFEAQTNVVVVKGNSLVNTITMSSGTFTVRSKQSLNVSTGQKQYGMLLGFDGGGNTERERAVVDYSELGSMLDGIDYLSRVTGDAT